MHVPPWLDDTMSGPTDRDVVASGDESDASSASNSTSSTSSSTSSSASSSSDDDDTCCTWVTMPRDRFPADLRGYPLAIVCARGTEFDHVIGALQARKAALTAHGKYVCGVIPVARGDCRLPFVLATAYNQTGESCAVYVAAMLERLQPQYVVMVGTCAALPRSTLRAGDVVVAQSACRYDAGAVHSYLHGGPFGPIIYATSYAHSECINAPIGAVWDVNDARENKVAAADFRAEIGALVSGSAPQKDVDALAERCHDELGSLRLLGHDLTASAFMHACMESGSLCLGAFKGVTRTECDDKAAITNALYVAIAAADRQVAPRFDAEAQRWHLLKAEIKRDQAELANITRLLEQDPVSTMLKCNVDGDRMVLHLRPERVPSRESHELRWRPVVESLYQAKLHQDEHPTLYAPCRVKHGRSVAATAAIAGADGGGKSARKNGGGGDDG